MRRPISGQSGQPAQPRIAHSTYRIGRFSVQGMVFDGIPGCLSWLALLLIILAAAFRPQWALTAGALIAFYAALHFLVSATANLRGLRRIQRWQKIDWQAEYTRLAGLHSLPREAVHHVVIIPNYQEPFDVLCRTLNRLGAQENATRQITVVLAMEAADPCAQQTAERLIAIYEDHFAHFIYTIHPAALPGEMQCKSANLNWAIRAVTRKLVDEWSYDMDRILVTAMDADTLWHPAHFSCLTTRFATDPNRHRHFWQAPIRYHGNIWTISPLVAIIHAYSAAWELAYLVAPWWIPLPISSYSLSLRLLDEVGYWDTDVIADEWHMFIKAYMHCGGHVQLESILLPFLGNATAGRGVWEAIKNRYQQTLRHAWGSKEVGYALSGLLQRPEIRSREGFNLVFRVAHDILLAGAGWMFMTVGPLMTFVLHPEIVDWTSPPFLLLQLAWGLVWLLSVIFWGLDMRLRPPRPHPWTWRERFSTILSLPLLPLLTLIFLALPTIQAQTLLMLGKQIPFRVTEKM